MTIKACIVISIIIFADITLTSWSLIIKYSRLTRKTVCIWFIITCQATIVTLYTILIHIIIICIIIAQTLRIIKSSFSLKTQCTIISSIWWTLKATIMASLTIHISVLIKPNLFTLTFMVKRFLSIWCTVYAISLC